MKPKCDRCEKPATIHLTEIVGGEKLEKHLCEDCASTEGITVKASVPISQLLEDFVLQSSKEGGAAKPSLKCDVCGITFDEFRSQGLLGCPNDYDVFESALVPLMERAHEVATQHIGKTPRRADAGQHRANAILRLRAELKNAVAAEDYEKAASIRDRIKELEPS